MNVHNQIAQSHLTQIRAAQANSSYSICKQPRLRQAYAFLQSRQNLCRLLTSKLDLSTASV